MAHAGLLGGRDMLVLASKGGGYQPGTPREGWDHAAPWLPHGISLTGLEPRFITVELTLADTNPQMAELKPLAAESLAAAERGIDAQWAPRHGVGRKSFQGGGRGTTTAPTRRRPARAR